MAIVVLQKGHCNRVRGVTGTRGEQGMASSVVDKAASQLRERGHSVIAVLADAIIPPSDAFVAVHMDGSTNPRASGASVGYPSADSAQLANAWKVAYQRLGWPYGFRPDNYTLGLARYYAFRRSGARFRMVIEAGFGTSPTDRAWIDANHNVIALSITHAVGALLGHPNGAPSPVEDESMFIREGASGDHVVKMQADFNRFLADTGGYDAGGEGGVYTNVPLANGTTAAGRYLRHDGQCGPRTVEAAGHVKARIVQVLDRSTYPPGGGVVWSTSDYFDLGQARMLAREQGRYQV